MPNRNKTGLVKDKDNHTETDQILHRIENIKLESMKIKERFLERLKTYNDKHKNDKLLQPS